MKFNTETFLSAAVGFIVAYLLVKALRLDDKVQEMVSSFEEN